MAEGSPDQLLDQLQHEVNEVWKQMGRLFAAVRINENGRAWPTGHVVKLKKMIPRSDVRFHAALDALEEELQMAKLVMRRDLAVCRERAGFKLPSEANGAMAATSADKPDAPKPEVASVEVPNSISAENVAMEDYEPSQPAGTAADAVMDDAPADENQETATGEAGTTADPTPIPDAPETSTAAPERNLHIDTQAPFPPKDGALDTTADEDKPPDTANFSTTNDLDSLFGGPLSAGAGEANAFTMDTNAASDFDFEAFSAGLDANPNVDNDNISSLLPGLEDYASGPAHGDEEINFDDFFAPVGGEGGGEQPGIPHRDSTFDGLQDLADFNVDEFTGGGGDGTDEAQDFEFDFLKD